MVELLGTCWMVSICCHVDMEISTYNHVKSVCEFEVSRKLKPYRKLRDEKRAYTGDSRYLYCLLATRKVLYVRDADLKRCDWYRWQRRGVFDQLFTRSYGTIKLDVCHEIVRPKFQVAVLDVVYDAFGNVDHAFTYA